MSVLTVIRDAVTGRFARRAEAEQRPRETVEERMTTHGGHHMASLTFENMTTAGATNLAHGEHFNIHSDGHNHASINVVDVKDGILGSYRDNKPLTGGVAGPFTAGDGPGTQNDDAWDGTGDYLYVFGFYHDAVDGTLNVPLVAPR